MILARDVGDDVDDVNIPDISYVNASKTSKNLLMFSAVHLSSWVIEQYSPIPHICQSNKYTGMLFNIIKEKE